MDPGAPFEVESEVDRLRHENAALRDALIGARRRAGDEQRGSEDARRSQRLLDAILEHLPAAVYLKDLAGRYLLASRRATELKGGGHSLLGRTDRELFRPPIAEAIAEHDRKVLEARKPIEFDEEIPTAAGPTTQLSIKFPVFGDDGAPIGLGGISTDITERKWMERLQEAERRALERTAQGAPFASVLSGIVDAIEDLGVSMIASILVLDEDGLRLRNGASSRGLPRELVDLTEGFPVGPSAATCGTAVFRGERVIVRDIAADPLWKDYRQYAVPHGLRACWSTPIVNARGEPLGTFAVYYREPREPPAAHLRVAAHLERTVSVILERHRAERERDRLVADLAAAHARYQGLFEGTAEAILVIAPDGRYLDANRAASELTGYSQDELRQMRVGDLADEPARVREQWARIAAGPRWSGEAQLRRKDGSFVSVETRIASVPLSNGVVHVSTMRDISERNELERLRRDFIAVIGHELRNPLNAIMGSAELMRASASYSQRSVDRILRQTRQLERSVTDLQEAQNIESGQLRLRPKQVDLLALVRASVDEAAAAMGTHPVRLEAADEPIQGLWDADRLGQVLRNLLSNAVKYSPRGSEVLVRVSAKGDRVEVSVTDAGPGIPKEALPRLFQKYYRAPQSAATVPGMGIGLFVCKELIERHGGKLTVTSEVGRGSTFSFELPRHAMLADGEPP